MSHLPRKRTTRLQGCAVPLRIKYFGNTYSAHLLHLSNKSAIVRFSTNSAGSLSDFDMYLRQPISRTKPAKNCIEYGFSPVAGNALAP